MNINFIGKAWITSWLYDLLLRQNGCITTTLDIGMSWEEVCVRNGEMFTSRLSFPLDLNELKPSQEDRVIVIDEKIGIKEAIVNNELGYYKLKAIGIDKAPTLEINGIHMHRITDVDPWKDSALKIRDAKVKKGNVVLDTCMGLGYTAILSVRAGATQVFTYEVDSNVFEIVIMNPWSRGLLDNKIKIFNKSVVRDIYNLPSNFFDRIIHDPPRLTKRYGDLYSLEFYKEIFRVLKPGGILYHYTGKPARFGRANIIGNIKSRLKKAGFRDIYFSNASLGLIAYKPI